MTSGGRGGDTGRHDALRPQLAIELFDRLRERVLPFAESRGLLTDEDVFEALS